MKGRYNSYEIGGSLFSSQLRPLLVYGLKPLRITLLLCMHTMKSNKVRKVSAEELWMSFCGRARWIARGNWDSCYSVTRFSAMARESWALLTREESPAPGAWCYQGSFALAPLYPMFHQNIKLNIFDGILSICKSNLVLKRFYHEVWADRLTKVDCQKLFRCTKKSLHRPRKDFMTTKRHRLCFWKQGGYVPFLQGATP